MSTHESFAFRLLTFWGWKKPRGEGLGRSNLTFFFFFFFFFFGIKIGSIPFGYLFLLTSFPIFFFERGGGEGKELGERERGQRTRVVDWSDN